MTINSKTLSMISTVLIASRPMLELALCPQLKNYLDEDSIFNNLCDTATTIATITPIMIGTTSLGMSATRLLDANLWSSIGPAIQYRLLPASVALLATQAIVKDKPIPMKFFIIGTVKSAVEIMFAGAVCADISAVTFFEKIAVTISTTNIINILFYMTKELSDTDKALNYTMLSDASSYAMGFCVARPIYGLSQDNNVHAYLQPCFAFIAPIARGAIMDAVGKGSVLVPGSGTNGSSVNYGNIIDGASLAIGSVAGLYFKHTATITFTMISFLYSYNEEIACILHNITDYISPMTDNALEYNDL